MVIDTLQLGLIKTNCYIVSENNNNSCVIIDPGSNPQVIIDHLQGKGLTPEYVFITHGHFDHFTAVPALREQYGFKLVIHEADAPALSDYQRSHYRGAPVAYDITVTDGQVITLDGLEFKWLHTPGHSLGSCVIQCENVLFSGDTLFYEECGRCDTFGGSFPNMLKSLKRLSELEGDFKVLSGHGQASTLNHEREHNPYMLEATNGK